MLDNCKDAPLLVLADVVQETSWVASAAVEVANAAVHPVTVSASRHLLRPLSSMYWSLDSVYRALEDHLAAMLVHRTWEETDMPACEQIFLLLHLASPRPSFGQSCDPETGGWDKGSEATNSYLMAYLLTASMEFANLALQDRLAGCLVEAVPRPLSTSNDPFLDCRLDKIRQRIVEIGERRCVQFFAHVVDSKRLSGVVSAAEAPRM